ncbi:MAG: hypothetical protein LW822_04180 [Phycisphaeraceae bacterium]|nr:hypothetical protein [Phycisphaeraceae bacterium]
MDLLIANDCRAFKVANPTPAPPHWWVGGELVECEQAVLHGKHAATPVKLSVPLASGWGASADQLLS